MSLKKCLALMVALCAVVLILSASGCRKDEPQDVEDVRQNLREQVRARSSDQQPTYTINEGGGHMTTPGDAPAVDTDVTRAQLQEWRASDLWDRDYELPDDDGNDDDKKDNKVEDAGAPGDDDSDD